MQVAFGFPTGGTDVKHQNKTEGKRPSKAGVITVAAVSALLLLFLGILLLGPMMAARPVFADALKAPKTSEGRIRLCDPYAAEGLLPETREVTVEGEDGAALVSRFLEAFSSYSYVETSGLHGREWLPYVTVTGARTACFYLEEDSVWVEKNSTFYCFRPRTASGRAAYAEFYRAVTDLLAASAEGD